ncbi:M20/M25/M40 family metallo-hydrolase [Actinomadura algeriensis]|uniref:Zn-dependent M28 family amino/carboxypeptidase n=1 Tax=Actinomadura algeriensis TaxID=1679523 RepID=A0ABR9JKM9_9ACTN|nr:M20/M25/M40 family metallo-hydrolase [Actinomadura algeriensis]MBE1531115.1 Zn-dependent M28 family amino/carboxypeptidase [Actinomadura algeriensis]
MRKLLSGSAVTLPAATVFLLALSAVPPAGMTGTAGNAVTAGMAGTARTAGAAGASGVPGAAPERGSDLAELVTIKDVRRHLEAFRQIAEYNGGNRASGTSGYEVSVKYVVGRLRKAGYSPSVQKFVYPYWQERSAPVMSRTSGKGKGKGKGKDAKKAYKAGLDFVTMMYSGSGDVTARVTPVDVPAKGKDGTSGCEKKDFKGFAKGSIALMQRGKCTFATKAARARTAGAAAAVIYNKPGEAGPISGTLGERSKLPVVAASHQVGAELAKAAAKGGLTMRVKTVTEHGKRTSSNVVADTERGRADNVVVAGAHLDSVPDGPGINDNATGAAALLAVAEEIGELGGKGLRNRVRFAWWGAEEEGLRGSTHYVEELDPSDRRHIALNLNFDMLGSPNGVRGVYDGDHSLGTGTTPPAGSAAIEKMFREYFKGRGLPTDDYVFNGRSDYGPFIEHGIPAGGLATGADGVKTAAEAKKYGGRAGKTYDPCYHAKCDGLKNVNMKLLDTNVDGVAHVTQLLAASTVAVNGDARLQRVRRTAAAPLWSGGHLLR